MVGPHDEAHEAQEDQGVDHHPVAPERLARVVRHDLGHDSHRRENEDINLRMGQEPEEVLPEERRPAPSNVQQFAANH